MELFDNTAIGQRIRALRKRKGYNQKELADIIGKSLRTVQKYESGEIEVSISVANQLAEVLDSTPTFILGFEFDTEPIRSLADIVNFLFKFEQVSGIAFNIDIQKPPRSQDWQCAITFNGKEPAADYNADMCLFLEDWADRRASFRTYESSLESYRQWKANTLAYYAATSVSRVDPEELTPEERLERRKAYLNSLYASQDSDM